MAARLLRHLFAPSATRRFPAAALARITAAIHASEATHAGEVCFAVEAALPLSRVMHGLDARTRAREVFAQLGVWDTAANNGVLLYVLLADHRLEIVADRGFDGRVGQDDWRNACVAVEGRLRDGDAEGAAIAGVEALSALVAAHFPRTEGVDDVDELPNAPRIL